MNQASQTFEFEKQVREACKHYNKPKRIGQLPIASLALQALLLEKPTHPTTLIARGQALQIVINKNLSRLKPKEKHSHQWEIYLCLSCYMHKFDFLRDKKIINLHKYFETIYRIPKATFNYRLKKEGIPQLSSLISTYLSQQLTWIESIPQITYFIGRENELIYYRHQLEQNQIAVIEGLGGIGKTALAARLASSIKDQHAVCWVTLRAGLNNRPMDILYAWAAFLAQHNYPQLWAFMRATAAEQKHLQEYYPILRDGLAKVQPLLCIDNLEILPKSEDGFWELLSLVQQEANVYLLLTSQQRPKLSSLDHYDLLSGLPAKDVRNFLIHRKLELNDYQLSFISNYTNGNLRLLDLWAAYVRQQDIDLETSLEKLLDSAATKAFLASEIIGRLTIGEKQVTKLLASSRLPLDSFILQEPPRHLAPLSDLEIEDSDFERLQRLGLIQQQSGNQWTVSLLLKDYINSSEINDTDDVTDLHEWLANLYLSQSNIIESAYHLIKADDAEQAVLLITKQQQILIQQGQASALDSIFNLIEASDLSPSAQEILRHLRIELWLLLGNYEAAEKYALVGQEEASTDVAKAHAIQIQGEVAKRQGYLKSATEFYENALSTLVPQRDILEIWLHRDLAWVLNDLNDLDKAWNEAQRAQIALNNTLGSIAQRRGDFELALNYYKYAVDIAKKCGEYRQLMRVRNSMAMLYWQKNQLEKSLSLYLKNIDIIEDIGDLGGKAITFLNLGLGYAELSQLDTAIEYTIEALAMFKQLDDVRGQMFANQNLAEQYLKSNQLENAREYAEAINEVDETLRTTREYAEGLRIYAEVLLAQGEPSPALNVAQEALNILQKSDKVDVSTNPFNIKSCYETLTLIHTALDNTAEAEKYDALANKLAKVLEK